MSEFNVPIVKLGKVGKHPNADTLSITTVFGEPVVFRTGDFEPGDLAVYVPIDAVIPRHDRWAFLFEGEPAERVRVRGVKLRGVPSRGLLVRAPEGAVEGQDMMSEWNVKKYDPPVPATMNGDDEPDPGFLPVYDIESHRKYRHLYEPGEDVVITEKIHGCNARFIWKDGRMWAASRNNFKKRDPNNLWWKAAEQLGIVGMCQTLPDQAIYGEVFGQVQDLRYGAAKGELMFRAFDIYDTRDRKWLDHEWFVGKCAVADVPTVPFLYVGPMPDHDELEAMASGKTLVGNDPKQIREGIVIRPVRERHNIEIGRTITKLVSHEYLSRKGGTEYH